MESKLDSACFRRCWSPTISPSSLAVSRLSATERMRARFTMLIGLICIAVCLVIAWYGFQVTLRDFVQNEKDVRSLDMPRWMVVGWIPLSFLMMAVEFARFVWRRENFLAPLSDITT